MDHPARTPDLLSVLERLQLLHFDFAALQRLVRLRALPLRQAIDPQQIRPALQLSVVTRIGQLHIFVERRDCVRCPVICAGSAASDASSPGANNRAPNRNTDARPMSATPVRCPANRSVNRSISSRKSRKRRVSTFTHASLRSWQRHVSFLSFHGCVVFAGLTPTSWLAWAFGREELGGLGSSHTTPFEAAVPARPP